VPDAAEGGEAYSTVCEIADITFGKQEMKDTLRLMEL